MPSYIVKKRETLRPVPFNEINFVVSFPIYKDPLKPYVIYVSKEDVQKFKAAVIKKGWDCYPTI